MSWPILVPPSILYTAALLVEVDFCLALPMGHIVTKPQLFEQELVRVGFRPFIVNKNVLIP